MTNGVDVTFLVTNSADDDVLCHDSTAILGDNLGENGADVLVGNSANILCGKYRMFIFLFGVNGAVLTTAVQ